MNRQVEPEWLDQLPPEDPQARGSRRDLRRLNRALSSASILSRALASFSRDRHRADLLEIGAGDGDLLSRVAQRLGPRWKGTRVTLLDRHRAVSEHAARIFREIGWELEIATRDIFDWCADPPRMGPGIVLTNLFLHHFSSGSLAALLAKLAQRSSHFVALEPRRSWPALIFSRLVGLIGCNAVTRHDAPVSVRAGFSGSELSRLWPRDPAWVLEERRAGAFGHLFVARSAGRSQNGHGPA